MNRGAKNSSWEGGNRGTGFIWSPLLEHSHYISNHLMHIADWLPTLLKVAGYDMNSFSHDHFDGFDMWDVLSMKMDTSPRTEVLYNIDPVNKNGALRVNNMKIVIGEQHSSGWYSPPQDSECIQGTCYVENNEVMTSELPLLITKALNRPFLTGRPVIVDCGESPANALTNCNSAETPCLFNLDADPCEYNNLAPLMPETVTELLERFNYYNSSAVPPRNKPDDLRALPVYNCGSYGPWINLDVEQ